jgi:type I restriction enzyme S subunit
MESHMEQAVKPDYKKTKIGWIPKEWNVKRLEDFAPLQRGFDLPNRRLEEGVFPVVYSNGILNYHSEFKVKGPGVLTGRSGTIGRVTYVPDDYWRHNTSLWVTDFKGNVPKFVYYYLQHLRLERFDAGTGVPTLNRNVVHSLEIAVPSIPEQNKITQILSIWDKAIELKEKLISAKEQQKKALMQKLISGRLRFGEVIDADWKLLPLVKCVIPVRREVQKPKTSFLALGIRSHGKGTFLKPNFDPSKISMETLYKVKKDDLIVNITFAWEGAIAIPRKRDDGALVSHRFPTYEFKRDTLLPEFFRYYILQKRFIYELGVISPGGAGRNRVLDKDDFMKLTVKVPSIPEQKKIGSVLSACDKEIGLLKQKLNLLKRKKKGLMQQLLTGKIRVKV